MLSVLVHDVALATAVLQPSICVICRLLKVWIPKYAIFLYADFFTSAADSQSNGRFNPFSKRSADKWRYNFYSTDGMISTCTNRTSSGSRIKSLPCSALQSVLVHYNMLKLRRKAWQYKKIDIYKASTTIHEFVCRRWAAQHTIRCPKRWQCRVIGIVMSCNNTFLVWSWKPIVSEHTTVLSTFL